jgi:hypothetical protein
MKKGKKGIKGQFILSYDCLLELINDIKKTYPLFSFSIEKSKNKFSKSLYLKIEYFNKSSFIRISDHYFQIGMRQIIVKDSTGKSAVKEIILSSIKKLKDKYLINKITNMELK